MHREGAELAFAYERQTERPRRKFAALSWVPASFYRVMSLNASIDAMFAELGGAFVAEI